MAATKGGELAPPLSFNPERGKTRFWKD